MDGLISELVHTKDFRTFLDESWVEEGLWSLESWLVDLNDGTIWELVVLLMLVGGGSGLHGGIVVKGDESKSLFNLNDDLEPSGLTTFVLTGDTIISEKLGHVLSDGSTSDVVLEDGVWDGETLKNWDSVGNTISGIDDQTGGSTIGVEGKDGLDGDINTLDLESLEHQLGHLFSVSFWISWGLSQKDFMLCWVNSELVGHAIFPDLFHIVPGGNNTGLDWVVEVENTSHLLGFISNVLGF